MEKKQQIPAGATAPARPDLEVSEALITQTVTKPLKGKENVFCESSIDEGLKVPKLKELRMDKMVDEKRKVGPKDCNATSGMEVDLPTFEPGIHRSLVKCIQI